MPEHGFSAGTPLKAVGEFGLIERLVKAWQEAGHPSGEPAGEPVGWQPAAALNCGVGDDAAVLGLPAGKPLLVTTDMLVEGVHFYWSASRVRLLGRKALAVNISDIAAMGGRPGWAFLSIGVPVGATVETVAELYAGMGEMAARYGVVLAGGDTVRSDRWVINVTLLGLARQKPLTRGGGRAGDLILVTGSVGDAAAGLYLLAQNEGERPADREYLLARHLDPSPRVAEAQALVACGGVTAMIDISDGVGSEINHICRASGCGALVDLAALPVSSPARRLAGRVNQPVIEWALAGGEDYELLFSAPPEQVPGLIARVKQVTGTPVTVIGRLTPPEEGVRGVHPGIRGGEPVTLPARGYNHFREGEKIAD
ncbi:MAG: thiamine-phosphate kinase [Heliobacteriaceae bacterium]|nr:thiamine-phosphate kinase [Heliobacteriaceae bacterium]